ncbi:MAG: outer membrane beta-barrel protein, partial [FCB group bacterium]
MKKYYFSVLFFIFCFYNVYPQIQQGKSLLGFSLSGDFSKENSKVIANGIRNSYSFSISPNFGIFLSDNFLIGLSIGYGISHSDYNTTDSTQPVVSELIRAHQISLAPFTRYYLSLGGKFYFFLQGTIFAGYNYRVVYSNSLIQDDAGINDFAFGLSFNPGVN